MPTVSVNLSTDEYVQVNIGLNPLILQAHRDAVRIAVSAVKPAKGNEVFHKLGGGDNPMQFLSLDTNVWALAQSSDSSLIVTSMNPLPVNVTGAGGAQVDASRYGQLVTGMRGDDVLVRFEYNNSTEDITPSASGTGVTSNADSMAIVSTGTGVGTAAIESNRSVAYRPGHEVYAFFTTLYGTPEVDTYQRHGLFNGTDGFYFGYEGDSFGVSLRKDGVDVQYPQEEWNTDKCDGTGESGFNLNHGSLLQYKITYGWLGSAPVTFWIYSGSERGWVLCHVIDQTNTSTSPTIAEPSQGVKFEVGRTVGTGADTSMKTSSWAAGTIEGIHTHAGHRVFAGEQISGLIANTESHIVTFRNKETFQGKSNKVKIEAVFMGVATDGNKSVLVRFRRNATIVGAVWNDVDADNSVTEIDTTGAYTVGTGKYELTVPVAKIDSVLLDLGAGHIHLELSPGESMTITGLSTNDNDVVITFRWEEYFS